MSIGGDVSLMPLEQIPDGEEDAIKRVVDFELRILQKSIGEKRPVPRAQHPKHHGCVKAEFLVGNQVPEEFRLGIFSQPGQTFPAWIRFSNARKQDDRESGGHGMAIKLMNVFGEQLLPGRQNEHTQDFLLLDSPIFFIKDAIQFAEFDAALLASDVSWFGKLSVLEYFLRHPREAWILHQIENNRSPNPLESEYWSATPYQLGTSAVKYCVKPRLNGPPIAAPASSPDQLRIAMTRNLETRDAYFDFCVQRQVNPADQPVEDPTHLWETPAQAIAAIHIPCQSFDTPSQMEFCENLSFSPWHALTEHRPLGSLNRLRRATYLALSDFRHDKNGVLSAEPTPDVVQSEHHHAA